DWSLKPEIGSLAYILIRIGYKPFEFTAKSSLMRRIIYILVVALLFSCTQEEEKYAAISLKPDDSNPIEFIQVRNPLEDVYLWGMKNDTLYRNENEEFLFKKKIEKPEYIIIGIGDKFLKAVLL